MPAAPAIGPDGTNPMKRSKLVRGHSPPCPESVDWYCPKPDNRVQQGVSIKRVPTIAGSTQRGMRPPLTDVTFGRLETAGRNRHMKAPHATMPWAHQMPSKSISQRRRCYLNRAETRGHGEQPSLNDALSTRCRHTPEQRYDQDSVTFKPARDIFRLPVHPFSYARKEDACRSMLP